MFKLEQFQRLFAIWGSSIEATQKDVREIDASPLLVVAHKASQFEENILVEDTSLEIEGADVGVNVRWLLDNLEDYVGRKAEWNVLLAYKHAHEVLIFKGSVKGTIVKPRGSLQYGFMPVFLPEGSEKTLSESMTENPSARAMAIENLIKGNIWAKHPVITNWQGAWQND